MDPIHVKRPTVAQEPSRHGPQLLKEVLLRGGVLPQVTQVATATIPPNQGNEFHEHPTMFEVYYVLSGEADYDIGDRSYSVGPGDFLVIPPGTRHRLRARSAEHRIFYWGIAVK